MIELTEAQLHALDSGEPLLLCVGGKAMVLLRSEVYRRIQAVPEVERSVISAGHTRGSVATPEPLDAIAADGLPDVVQLPADRFAEIQELVIDDRERMAWNGAIATARESWAKENPYQDDSSR